MCGGVHWVSVSVSPRWVGFGYLHWLGTFVELTTAQRSLLTTMAELAYCNPFSPLRMKLEQHALGDHYRAEEQLAWSRTPQSDHHERPNVVRLTKQANELCNHLHQRIEAGEKLDSQTHQLYDDLVTYVLYYRHVAPCSIEQLYADTRAVRDKWRAFVTDYRRFHLSLNAETAGPAAAHLFACLCQVRRAFRFIFDCILGESAPAGQLREMVWQSIFTHNMRRYRRALYSQMRELATLITGPSGTGKELVARAVALSQYLPFDAQREAFVGDLAGAFTPLNLSALSPTLIESELFGHRKGSFTGATSDRAGWLESCQPHGAVFLDEIGELDMAIQVKLLRVVQNRTYCRLGETDERSFQGKLIAATNRDLGCEIDAGRFRHDLYYRLCSDRIETPTLHAQLSDRPQALAGLIRFLAFRIAGDEGDSLAEEVELWIAENLPADYPWPGNIRELEQCVRNVLVRQAYTPRIQAESAPCVQRQWLADAEAGRSSADQLLRHYATWLYAKQGTYEAVAKIMGLDRRTVKSKIEEAMLAEFREN